MGLDQSPPTYPPRVQKARKNRPPLAWVSPNLTPAVERSGGRRYRSLEPRNQSCYTPASFFTLS